MAYQSKNNEFEAFQVGVGTIPDWFVNDPNADYRIKNVKGVYAISIQTKYGQIYVPNGDWIMKNLQNEYSASTDAVFKADYEVKV